MYKEAIMHTVCVMYMWVCAYEYYNTYNYKYTIFTHKWDMYAYFDCDLAIIKKSFVSAININVNNFK